MYVYEKIYDIPIFQFWFKLRIPLQFPTYMWYCQYPWRSRLVALDEAWQGVRELIFVFVLQIRRKKYFLFNVLQNLFIWYNGITQCSVRSAEHNVLKHFVLLS